MGPPPKFVGLADKLAWWWFSAPWRVKALEGGSLALVGMGVMVIGCATGILFFRQMEIGNSQALTMGLGMGLLACLSILAYGAWRVAGWMAWDAFETNAAAVKALNDVGIGATIDWHLSQAEQELLEGLWGPGKIEERRQFRSSRI